MERILMTGANGLIGKALTPLLIDHGYEVVHLLRKAPVHSKVPFYTWDPEKEICDPVVFEGVDYIMHLAGENIGAKRWTVKRKRAIRDSRVKTAELLFKKSASAKLKGFICASGISIYGTLTSEHIFDEADQPAKDFLAQVTLEWERAADQFRSRGLRVVKLRTAPVLAADEGVLKKMATPVRWGFGAVLGSGKQHFPWIHIDDVCGMYLKAVRDSSMEGAYNAAAPDHCTNKEFTRALAKSLNKRIWLPKVPAFALKLMFGEMGNLVLKGSRVSSEKIQRAGYGFKQPLLSEALRNLLA